MGILDTIMAANAAREKELTLLKSLEDMKGLVCVRRDFAAKREPIDTPAEFEIPSDL